MRRHLTHSEDFPVVPERDRDLCLSYFAAVFAPSNSFRYSP